MQVSAVFGRLRPKFKKAEAEEDGARKENDILKSALAKARHDYDIASYNNGCLRTDLAKTKEELKTSRDALKSGQMELTTMKEELAATKENHKVIVDMNVDLVQRNEALVQKNEILVKTNKSMALQVNEFETREIRHMKERQKLEDEVQELRPFRDLGPPLTEDLRKQIREEYRTSEELNNEILDMCTEGYEICRSRCKKKLVKAKVDPTLLDSSDGDEDDED